MFRPATIREVEALLKGQGRELPVRKFAAPSSAAPQSGHAPYVSPMESTVRNSADTGSIDTTMSQEELDKQYKKSLSDGVRACMLTQATKFLLGELRDKAQRKILHDVSGLSFSCTCFDQRTSCVQCQGVCTNFAEGVLTVLERDFVQLTHGKGAKLLQNRVGVQFLLTGITLGLLYESLPESTGLNELMLQVLIIMLDLKTWDRALTLYGAAPSRAYDNASTDRSAKQHRHARVRSHHGSGHGRKGMPHGPSSLGSNATDASEAPDATSPTPTPPAGDAADVNGANDDASSAPLDSTPAIETPDLEDGEIGELPDATARPPLVVPRGGLRRSSQPRVVSYYPHHCAECEQPFDNADAVQECDCGAVTVRYLESRTATAADMLNIVEDNTPLLRPRAYSF